MSFPRFLRSERLLLLPLGLAVALYAANAINQLGIRFYLHYAETVRIILFGLTADLLIRLVASSIVVSLGLSSHRLRPTTAFLVVAVALDSWASFTSISPYLSAITSSLVIVSCSLVATRWYSSLGKTTLALDLLSIVLPSFISIQIAAALGWIIMVFYRYAGFGGNQILTEYMAYNIPYPFLTSMYVLFLFSWLIFPIARRVFHRYVGRTESGRLRLTKWVSLPKVEADRQNGTLGLSLLVGSFLLAAIFFGYVYSLQRQGQLVGQDLRSYIEPINAILNGRPPQVSENRLLVYVLLAYATKLFMSNPFEVLKYSSLVLMISTSLATFMFMYVGRRSLFEAGLASFLAVASLQTAIGFPTGIISNWLAETFLLVALILLTLQYSNTVLRIARYSGGGFLVAITGLAHRLVFLGLSATLIFTAIFEAAARRNEARWIIVLASFLGGSLVALLVIFGGQIAAEYAYLTQGIGLTPSYVLGRLLAADGFYVLANAFQFIEQLSAGVYSIYPALILGILGMFTLSRCRNRFETLVTCWLAAASLATYLLAQFGISGSNFTWTQLWRGLFVVPIAIPAAVGLSQIIRFLNSRREQPTTPDRSVLSTTQSTALTFAIAVFGASWMIADVPWSLLGVYVATSVVALTSTVERRHRLLAAEVVAATLLAMTIYILRSMGTLIV